MLSSILAHIQGESSSPISPVVISVCPVASCNYEDYLHYIVPSGMAKQVYDYLTESQEMFSGYITGPSDPNYGKAMTDAYAALSELLK